MEKYSGLDWSTSFNPNEIGVESVAVSCLTYESAKEFLETFMPYDKDKFLSWWKDYRSETAYFIRKDLQECMFGPKRSLDGYWEDRGYVPRTYYPQGISQLPEVGDLL